MIGRIEDELESGGINAPKGAEAHRVPKLTLYLGRSPSPIQEPASPAESEEDGLECARGSLLAICFELVVSICFYGIWEAWRLFR